MSQVYLTERQAAFHLSISPKTLQRWRCIHQGPRVHRFGSAIRYKLEDLTNFAASCSAGGE